MDKNLLRDMLEDKIDYWEGENDYFEKTRDEDILEFSTDFLNYLFEVNDFKLYRYSKPDYYNIRNIETQRIHLSPNGILNDAYEGFANPCSEEDRFLHNRYLEDMAYMSCFTEDNDNLLMWSHYGDNHRGICVEYDIKKMITSEEIKHIFPIVYKEYICFNREYRNIASELKELERDINDGNVHDDQGYLRNILPLFVVKGTEWSYEKEWRLIYTKYQMYEKDNDNLYKGIIDFPYISAIYLGCKTEKSIEDHLKEIVNRLNSNGSCIKLFKSKLNNLKYGLSFEEIVL